MNWEIRPSVHLTVGQFNCLRGSYFSISPSNVSLAMKFSHAKEEELNANYYDLQKKLIFTDHIMFKSTNIHRQITAGLQLMLFSQHYWLSHDEKQSIHYWDHCMKFAYFPCVCMAFLHLLPVSLQLRHIHEV